MREQPVERLVEAAIWHTVEEADGGRGVEFDWAAGPALGEDEQVAFLVALVAEIRRQAVDAAWIAPASWLPEGHTSIGILEAAGFAVTARRSLYGVEAAKAREILASQPTPESPGELRAPAPEDFEALRALLCGPALRPADLALGMRSAASHQPSLYDPRCSAVCLRDGEITAACLAQSSHGHLGLAALVGAPEECDRLLVHCLQGRDGLPEPATLGFQIDRRLPAPALTRLTEILPCHSAGDFLRFEKSS